MPRNGRLVRRREDWNRGTRHAIELVETDDIGMVENIKRLNDEVELSVLTYFEEFQDPQVALHLSWVASEFRPKPANGQSLAFCCRKMVKFPGVPRRTATSIVLVTVLLAGITPTGLCTLLCERHSRAESQRRCSQPSGSMSGMAHDHSAMNHSSVEAMSAVLVSQSCRTNCATTERLSVWRRIVPQVTAVRSDTVVLGSTAEVLARYFTAAWGLDSGPPTRSPARAASFSILRI